MRFEIKPTKEKVKSSYKTLYLSDELILKLTEIADENNTSFNNTVVSMIEACLKEYSSKSEKAE